MMFTAFLPLEQSNWHLARASLPIYFKDTAKDVEMQLEKLLQMADYTKSAVFVSSEEGKKNTEDLGEDCCKLTVSTPSLIPYRAFECTILDTIRSSKF
jgi:hypothetical protein